MASPTSKFPGPNYNNVIESDPQIIAVPLEKMDWGARKSALPGSIKNDQIIEHVKSRTGKYVV